MADLLTKNSLALWTQRNIADVERDDFATEVIDKVSKLAQFLGGKPLWTLEAGVNRVPFDVEMVVLQVCKRTYGNPGQVVQEGNVGPIGGDRVLDVAALLMDLTDSERNTLTKYNPDGDPDGQDGELWIMKTGRGNQSSLIEAAILYVNDDQQINMHPGQSAYPSWSIPLFNPGDPGDPNHYED